MKNKVDLDCYLNTDKQNSTLRLIGFFEQAWEMRLKEKNKTRIIEFWMPKKAYREGSDLILPVDLYFGGDRFDNLELDKYSLLFLEGFFYRVANYILEENGGMKFICAIDENDDDTDDDDPHCWHHIYQDQNTGKYYRLFYDSFSVDCFSINRCTTKNKYSFIHK